MNAKEMLKHLECDKAWSEGYAAGYQSTAVGAIFSVPKRDQLVEHQCLMQGTETWHFVDGKKTISVHPQGRFKADNGLALAAAAAAGLGIAALPDFLSEKELASGALVALMSRYPLPDIGIFLVRPPGHHPARKIRVLTELLIEHFG
jgi:DNA-binding transcriptional LysR family regulator